MITASDHTFAICAYKENPFLEEAVRSIIGQSELGQVFICTATPNDYISDIAKRYELPIIINTEGNTASSNWNWGYDHAETEYVTIIHQDDYYEPDYLETVINTINEYPSNDISILFSDYYEIRNDEVTADNRLLAIKRAMNYPLRWKALNKSVVIKRRVLSLGDPICCPSVTLHKSLIGKSPYDRTRVSSYDYYTWIKLANKNGRFVYIPKKLLGHRIYEGSGTTANIASNIRQEEDLAILEGFWPKPIAKFISSVYAQAEKSNAL